MCGRFNLRTSIDQIVEVFLPGLEMHDSLVSDARYNIAPTQPVLCVVDPGDQIIDVRQERSGRQLTYFRWGLIPPWAKDLSIGNKMINARSETVAEKPSFKSALKSRRCIIPVDGYYEWLKTSGGKQPFEFSAADGTLLALAGLWERNNKVSQEQGTTYSCTILTTSANRFMSEIHDRMPVVLPQKHWDQWLDPDFNDMGAVQSMLVPAPEDLLKKQPVSRKLNNVRNQGAELMTPDAGE